MASRTLVLYVAIVLALTFNSVCFGEQVLAPELAIKSYGSIVEGRSIRLEVMVDFHSDQAPVGFTLEDVEWDLDGDQVFGEDGASASRGSELGRMVSLALSELQGASTVGVRVKASLSVDSQQFNLEAQTDLSLINAAPEVLIGSSEFQAIGSVASLSASCRDPGQDESFVEWDLDNDGIFGEEGLEALGGNERGSSVQFTTSVDPTNSRVARVRARCQDVEKATGRIQSSNVLIPELQRSCNCAIPKGIPYNQMHLLGAAKFDKKTNKANVLLTSGSHPSSGAVFYPTPLTVTDNGIELCAKYQLSSLQNIPSKHAGSFSIIFTSSIPSSDVIESAHSSGLTIQFSESAEPSLVFFNPTGISQSSVSLKYPTLSRNSHYLSLRHRNGRTTVWIDGIELIDTEFALFPVSVVSRANNVYYGFSADSKAGALPVFAVEATTRVCSIPQI